MARRRRPRRPPRDLSRGNLWIYLAVVVFVLLDIALIALAVGSNRADDSGKHPHPIPTFSATNPSASPQPSSSAQPTSTTAVAPTRLLAALNAGTAWRATTGACPATPAAAQLTTDSGATWKTTDVTGPTKVTALQRIIATGKSQATMVGLTESGCSPQLVKTFVAGDNYSTYPKELAATWYASPADPSTVHSPSGELAAPCAVIALAPRDSKSAAVLCADDTVHVTADAAKTWAVSASLPGAMNLATSGDGYLAAVAGAKDCAGVQIVALSAGLVPSVSGCYATVTPSAGTVALSEAAGTLWLWAGDALSRSTDGGATWR